MANDDIIFCIVNKSDLVFITKIKNVWVEGLYAYFNILTIKTLLTLREYNLYLLYLNYLRIRIYDGDTKKISIQFPVRRQLTPGKSKFSSSMCLCLIIQA